MVYRRLDPKRKNPTPVEEEKFWDYLEVNDIYSEASRIRAIRSLRYLGTFFDLVNPSRDEISKYVKFSKKKGNVNKTIETHLAALKHYNRMLGHDIWVPKQRKQSSPQQYVATPEDLTKIFRYTTSLPSREYSALLTSIFLIASSTGCRIGELARLNVDDIRSEEGGIYIRAEKQEQNRIVGVAPEVLEFVQEYIDNYRLKPSSSSDKGLFQWYHHIGDSRDRVNRYEPDSLRNLIRERAEAAGCTRISSHTLRRFAGTELFRQGADFRRVQFHLGHRDPKSTLPYVRILEQIEARKNSELLRPFFKKQLNRR